jgi:phage terminase large subunit-like protein
MVHHRYKVESRPDQKIDAAVALMMAIGRAMEEDEDAKGLGRLPHESELRVGEEQR